MKFHPECELLFAFWTPLNCWHVAMKFHPGCELLCAFWAPFELLICHYEISSSLWVAMCLLGFIWTADMPLWNPIQKVSCCVPPWLYLIFWHTGIMKFHPECELLCASLALFELLTHSYEISSRMWVAVCLLDSLWIANMQPWNFIQDVSCCVPSWLPLNFWYAAMKFHPACELLCAFWAFSELLTAAMKFLLGSRLLCFLGSLWIADMQPWNPFQEVSCCVLL